MVHEVQLPRSARSSDRSRFDRSGGGEGKTINAAPQVDTKGSCVVAVDTKGLLCRGWWWTKGVCFCWLGTRRRWGDDSPLVGAVDKRSSLVFRAGEKKHLPFMVVVDKRSLLLLVVSRLGKLRLWFSHK